MKPGLLHRMDLWARHLLPVGLTLFLLLMTLVPSRVPGMSGLMPALVLMAVFYWAIYRPDLLPAHGAFLIGLLQDVVDGTPIGVTALVLLLVHGVAASQRRFFLGNTFIVAWWGFALVAAVASLLTWGLVGVLHGWGQPRAVLFQYLMTLATYPVVSWILARLHVTFLRDA
ncbi:rod shape-determining protein MreD [Telmatospirillum sp. J64-1]|uniref:rod shape-determining protein MreD n=1 Tax=Telmatospirillum sp. J64-1 TaxID=2502183 RepID=UPI00115CAE0D|nr:rod shape-determining protein MreD [Telmatospirillum sp. J64-1]